MSINALVAYLCVYSSIWTIKAVLRIAFVKVKNEVGVKYIWVYWVSNLNIEHMDVFWIVIFVFCTIWLNPNSWLVCIIINKLDPCVKVCCISASKLIAHIYWGIERANKLEIKQKVLVSLIDKNILSWAKLVSESWVWWESAVIVNWDIHCY